MAIKLLPASVNPADLSQNDQSQVSAVSTSLVPLTQRAIAAQASQISLVPSADTFVWSSSTRRGHANRISGTVVEDSLSDATGRAGGEYVSGWAWSRPIEKTAIGHYLFYAAYPVAWRGQLISLYA